MGTVQDEGRKERRKERRKEGRSEDRKTSWLGFHLQLALQSKQPQLEKSLYLDNRRPSTEGVLQGNSTQHQQSGLLPWVALPSG